MSADQTNTAEAVERYPLPWAYNYTTGVISDGNGKTIARLAARIQTTEDPFGAKTGGRIVGAINEIDRLRSRIMDLEKAQGPLADIAAERRRQVEVEGWTVEHDDAHASDEMAMAAICYADPNPPMVPGPDHGDRIGGQWYPDGWPWSPGWWKPTTRRRNLVKAAALIVAEIERIDRAAARLLTEGRK